MRRNVREWLIGPVFVVGLAFPLASPGQPTGQDRPQQSSSGAEASPELRRHHAMRGVMDDMAQEMAVMQEQMAKDTMTPGSQREMAAQMKRLSELMRRMSGLLDRPTMKEPEMAKQLDQMREQMEELKKGHSMPAEPGKAGGSKR
jgi:TolA-binding protein